MFQTRSVARKRFNELKALNPESFNEIELSDESNTVYSELSLLEEYFLCAGMRLPAKAVMTILSVIGLMVGLVGLMFLPFFLVPIFLLVFFLAAYVYFERKIEAKALEFSSEYPSVLMATASSVKAGMTPYDALERSVRLLPKTSLVRTQIEQMLASLRKGVPRAQAIPLFGRGVRLPDVELFHDAFMIILDHGGRFAPTLERLSEVCKDRSTLIRSANVTTATMRVTANILLAVAPFIVGLVALRTENFLGILMHDLVAHPLAMGGALMIGISYVSLLKMSSFRP